MPAQSDQSVDSKFFRRLSLQLAGGGGAPTRARYGVPNLVCKLVRAGPTLALEFLLWRVQNPLHDAAPAC